MHIGWLKEGHGWERTGRSPSSRLQTFAAGCIKAKEQCQPAAEANQSERNSEISIFDIFHGTWNQDFVEQVWNGTLSNSNVKHVYMTYQNTPTYHVTWMDHGHSMPYLSSILCPLATFRRLRFPMFSTMLRLMLVQIWQLAAALDNGLARVPAMGSAVKLLAQHVSWWFTEDDPMPQFNLISHWLL